MMPFMKLYPRDWLSSRAVRLMTVEQRGAYFDLLCHAWLSAEPGVLVADDLPTLSGLGPEGFLASKAALARAFDTISRPHYWIQKRMVLDACSIGASIARASAHGRKGAFARWHSNKNLNAVGMPEQSSGHTSSDVRRQMSDRIKRRSVPDRALPPAFIAEMSERFALPLETVQLLAEKITLEFDARGYKSARSALLTWCKREAASKTAAAPPSPPRPTKTIEQLAEEDELRWAMANDGYVDQSLTTPILERAFAKSQARRSQAPPALTPTP